MKQALSISFITTIAIALGLLTLGSLTLGLFISGLFTADVKAAANVGERDPVVFAAQGRVEGASAPISLGFTISGRVQSICCQEGIAIKAGQELARLECGEENAAAAAEQANLEALRSKYLRAKRGHRTEERAVAAAREVAQKAEWQAANSDYARIKNLFEQGSLASKREYEQARRRLSVAQAAMDVTTKEGELANAALLPEENAHWLSDITAAEARARGSVERAAQCRLISPVSGTLLRRQVEVSETVSTFAPRTALVVIDTSQTRVRVEVDERDAMQVRAGQSAIVAVPNSAQETYPGKVIWISPVMGRKNIRGTDPAEKSDQDVREILVQLEKPTPLPIGLRVNAKFLKAMR